MAKEATAKAGHNSLAEEGKKFVERVENLQADIEHEQALAAEAIMPIREDIAKVLAEAEAAGITKASVKAVVKARKLARRAAEARDKLDMADQSAFDTIRRALGELADTELGKAALEAAA